MSLIKHTAEERIFMFFDKYCTTPQAVCGSIAEAIAGSDLSPSSTQGAFSYTLIGTEVVIQFRAQISPLNIQLLKLARSVHGTLVPRVTTCSRLINDPQINVYRMDRLPGENYSLLSLKSPGFIVIEKQENTLKGLAHFFAQAWKHPQQVSASTIVKARAVYQYKLEQLTQSLPIRYADLLLFCKNGFDYAFNEHMPWTVTHGDLCASNLLVNAETGELTGVVDWAECIILPFGLALWGLETVLGYMDESRGRWVYYEGRKQLEAVFWKSLELQIGLLTADQVKGVLVTRLLGLFCRHAFKFNAANQIPKDETWDLSLLDGQVLMDNTRWFIFNIYK